MQRIYIAGLPVDRTSKKESLECIIQRMRAGEKTFVITPYSEFLYRSLQTPQLLELFNRSNISVPDGIGIFWAAKFMQIPLTAKNYYVKLLQAGWQAICTQIAILLFPMYIRNSLNSATPNAAIEEEESFLDKEGLHSNTLSLHNTNNIAAEKISGSDLVWDLAKLASDNGWSIYLLGGFSNTPKLVAKKLKTKYSLLKVAGYSNKNPNDPTVIEDIEKAKPDMVFVAYGPVTQEQWIADHMDKLMAKFYIGLGGTFDYIAGTQKSPPQFIRKAGLEWFYRLLTQPRRWKRIWQATIGLTIKLIQYKVQVSLPYRKNVVAVVLNRDYKIFVGLRRPDCYNRNINHWMLPQGGLEVNEEISQGAMRELNEETGIKNASVIKISNRANSYRWEFGYSKIFKGQEQTPVYIQFTGIDSEIQLDQHHIIEFIDYKWVPIESLIETVHPLRKPLAKMVVEELNEMGYSTKTP